MDVLDKFVTWWSILRLFSDVGMSINGVTGINTLQCSGQTSCFRYLDKYLTWLPFVQTLSVQDVRFQNSYRLYTSTEAYWNLPYDYCSITHDSPTKYSKPGSAAFIMKFGPQAVPTTPQLSNIDCQLITRVYGGTPSLCPACKNSRL